MKQQYIFGNPYRKGHKMAKRRKHTRKSSSKKHSRRKPKNPVKYTYIGKSKKTGQKGVIHKSAILNTTAEVARKVAKKASLQERRLKAKKRKAKRKFKKPIARMQAEIKRARALRQHEKELGTLASRSAKESGASVSRKASWYNDDGKLVGGYGYKAKKRRKKRKGGKRRSKRKSVKRSAKVHKTKRRKHAKRHAKHTKKRSAKKHSKKRHAKKHQAKKRHAKKHHSKKKHSSKRRRGKRRMRRNPIISLGGNMKLQTFTGFDVMEVGALGLGGIVYGGINAALPRIPLVGQLQTALMRVPVIGTSLAPFLVGAVANYVASNVGFVKSNPTLKKAMELFGRGMVGASVVGMGVNASQYIPGLAPAPMQGPYSQLGGSPDFGNIRFTPGMGNIQFTPGLSGVDNQMGGAENQLGGAETQLGGLDFTAGPAWESEYRETYGQGADFGNYPEGL